MKEAGHSDPALAQDASTGLHLLVELIHVQTWIHKKEPAPTKTMQHVVEEHRLDKQTGALRLTSKCVMAHWEVMDRYVQEGWYVACIPADQYQAM